jgi:HPt (histidine-containing phosphotransfer) domain-containing protein
LKSRDQEAQFAELRTQYRNSLPERLERIQAALELRNYTEILRVAHQLHGSGKAYGFPAVSDAGEAVEQACRAEQIVMIRSAVALLEQTIVSLKSQCPEDAP